MRGGLVFGELLLTLFDAGDLFWGELAMRRPMRRQFHAD